MTTAKYLFLFGGILIGLVVLMAAGAGLLILLLDELSKAGILILPQPIARMGLIGAGILVATGFIIKLRIAPKSFPKLVKGIYQLHASLVASGLFASILFTGHLIMD